VAIDPKEVNRMSNPSSTPRRVRIENGIYRRPDKRLEIGWRDAQGKQRWKVVGGGIKAARAALAQEHARRARGEALAADPRLTFNDAADAWWAARVSRLRPGTQRAYAVGLKHLRAHFGSQRMTRISASDVAQYIAGKQLKGWTLKGHLTVLSAVFKYANRHLGVATPNPVAMLDRVERPSTGDEKPKRILTGDELTRLVAAVDARHRLIFRVAAETGCRIAEALGLAWEDIDVRKQTITFAFQLDRSGERVPLKTARSRRVLEITPGLAGELRRHSDDARSSAGLGAGAQPLAVLGARALRAVLLDREIDLGAMHGDVARRGDAQAHLVAVAPQDRNLDVVADHDALLRLACENEHVNESGGRRRARCVPRSTRTSPSPRA
jgi:integrase